MAETYTHDFLDRTEEIVSEARGRAETGRSGARTGADCAGQRQTARATQVKEQVDSYVTKMWIQAKARLMLINHTT
jgi:hypothetical protein